MVNLSLPEYLSECVEGYRIRRRKSDLADGYASAFCIRHIPADRSRLSTLIVRLSPREDGICCRGEFPVTKLDRNEALARFIELVRPHEKVGKLDFPLCDVYSAVTLELGVKTEGFDDAAVSAMIDEVCDHIEAVMVALCDPLLEVIAGGDAEAFAARCIPNLPEWTGGFTPQSLCDAPIPKWLLELEDAENSENSAEA